ncbi:FecR domain-containing protein [Pseudomonas sp. HLT2-19-2]
MQQNDGRPISEAVADQAVDWLTLLMSGESTEHDQLAWRAWRAANPEHERAWCHIEAMTGQLKTLAPKSAYQILSPYARQENLNSRRTLLRSLFWGSLLAGSGLLASRSGIWHEQLADHRTNTGEQRTLTLSDGTRLTLNTATAIDLHFDSNTRRLRLRAGEILVITAAAQGVQPADPRPFEVETAQGRIRALGTRFTVRLGNGHTAVAVQESAVQIQPIRSDRVQVLLTGQQAGFSPTHIDSLRALSEVELAWTQGQIIADELTLGAFIAELDRYRPGVLRCDPKVAGLRLSGVFPLHDTDRILATLPSVLPVRIRSRSRYWVLIEKAG